MAQPDHRSYVQIALDNVTYEVQRELEKAHGHGDRHAALAIFDAYTAWQKKAVELFRERPRETVRWRNVWSQSVQEGLQALAQRIEASNNSRQAVTLLVSNAGLLMYLRGLTRLSLQQIHNHENADLWHAIFSANDSAGPSGTGINPHELKVKDIQYPIPEEPQSPSLHALRSPSPFIKEESPEMSLSGIPERSIGRHPQIGHFTHRQRAIYGL
ncbi:hypothetical protein JCM10908_003664 [Rhodotorula pacifica]|uniref:uncharacterized protein n=1 Tax=Rhodotorula pacifica TaxID=1495444 RepID=UPI003171189F